jgi:NADH-quinone oxidoreductase subunit M
MREWIVLGAFAAGVLAVGVYPKPLTDLMEPAVQQLVQQLSLAKM